MHWQRRPVKIWAIALAEMLGAVSWWHCPGTKHKVLRSRAGHLYDLRYFPIGGWAIRKRCDPFMTN